ncbi:MAG: diguanylate cyclase [Lachnospiraceae bacterium]|nr:diguanylate cyclase [Lachnospiraceae bacterium]
MANWIIIVDDDVTNLKMAGHILSKNQMRATAMKSGRLLIDYLEKNEFPDLILLDINMPEMDGFETLRQLRALEKRMGRDEVPVIFLTADEGQNTETLGFEAGVSDYIRKPFVPDVLLRRINNILSKQEQMHSLKTEASTDKLTGFLNKGASAVEYAKLCENSQGSLLMIDLDSFKLVNDLYGHEKGDRILENFAQILQNNLPSGSVIARNGGDEFMAFCRDYDDREGMKHITATINEQIQSGARRILGPDMEIPLGASIGVVRVPSDGRIFDELSINADRALYQVKQHGKHGVAYHGEYGFDEEGEVSLRELSVLLEERNIPNASLQLDRDAFIYVYRYLMRYINRNHQRACKLLFTLKARPETGEEEFATLLNAFGDNIRDHLRKSDVFTRVRKNAYLVMLMDVDEAGLNVVLSHILDAWDAQNSGKISVETESEMIGAR